MAEGPGAARRSVPPNNLPRPLTSFIGRREDIAALGQSLAGARLLTLLGPGGCGKTRLALEAATAAREAPGARDAWPGGVWWIDLAPLTDPALVVPAIAAALRLSEKAGENLLDAVASRMEAGRALLTLDNCEHLVERCAQVVGALLAACPALTILATSRETLNVDGEMVYAVSSLRLPAGDAGFEAISQCDAARLFAERARAAAPDFALTPATAEATAAICRRLDGLPLAIELAASRVRALSPDAIAARLSAAIPLLTGGSRTAAPRHQTLRATLDWSYALLGADEARFFERLAVFAGGFTLEAAEAVGGEEPAAPGAPSALDLLTHLIDKSLVTVLPEPGPWGERRYRLLELLRQYGVERLEASGRLDEARRRHAAYYLTLAERAETELEGAAQLHWLNRLEQEHDNVRAALRWSIEVARDATAARIASSVWRFWLTRGYMGEGRRWLRQALDLIPTRDLTHAHALLMLSILSFQHEGYDAALAGAEEALTLYRALGSDIKGLAVSALNMGILALSHGDHARALSLLEEALPLCAQVNYAHGVILALSWMGQAALSVGEYARAQALTLDAVTQARAAGDTRTLAGALTDLGVTFFEQGAYTRATPYFEESMTLRRLHGDKGGLAHTLCYLGKLALAGDRAADARAHFLESFALRVAISEVEGQAAALEGLAAVAARAGDGVTAARRLGAAAAARERIHSPVPALDRPFVTRWTQVARDALGAEDFAREEAAGRALTPEEAVAEPAAAPVATPVAAVGAPAEPAAPAGDVRDGGPRAQVELRVYGFGAPRVALRGRLLAQTDWTYAKARELLYFLLTRGAATKEQIGLALWPDAGAAYVRQQLHPALHALRRALGDQGWVLFERGRYRFNRQRPHSYDVVAFGAALTQARQALAADRRERAVALLESATQLYHGDFLAGETGPAAGEWIATERAALRQQWLEAGATLAGLLARTGEHARAVTVYRRMIEADPYQEQTHRALMLSLAGMGERAQALRHYDTLARLLREELATTPAPETAALAESLRGAR